MSLLIRSCAALLLTLSLPLAAAPAPMHAQFLPPDDLTLRDAVPEQQQLLQVTEYSVVVGSQRQSTQQTHGAHQANTATLCRPRITTRPCSSHTCMSCDE